MKLLILSLTLACSTAVISCGNPTNQPADPSSQLLVAPEDSAASPRMEEERAPETNSKRNQTAARILEALNEEPLNSSSHLQARFILASLAEQPEFELPSEAAELFKTIVEVDTLAADGQELSEGLSALARSAVMLYFAEPLAQSCGISEPELMGLLSPEHAGTSEEHLQLFHEGCNISIKHLGDRRKLNADFVILALALEIYLGSNAPLSSSERSLFPRLAKYLER